MKNITVSVPDDIYREARMAAVKQDTSVSSLVTDFLRSLTGSEAEFRRLERLQAEATESIKKFAAEDRLGRDQVHARAVR